MATSTNLRKTAIGKGPRLPFKGRLPGEQISAFVDAILDGDDEDDTQDPQEPSSTVTAHAPSQPAAHVASQPAEPPLEPVVRRLLSGPHRSHFLLLADWYESAVIGRATDVWVETEVGDVRFSALEWQVTPGFLKLVVDSDKMPFEPKPLSKLRLRTKDARYITTCVSALMPMIGDLPFKELFLIIDEESPTSNAQVEKNARIEVGRTPSAVSGRSSTSIDNEEPVAEGEKAASLREPLPTPEDFDTPRDD